MRMPRDQKNIASAHNMNEDKNNSQHEAEQKRRKKRTYKSESHQTNKIKIKKPEIRNRTWIFIFLASAKTLNSFLRVST